MTIGVGLLKGLNIIAIILLEKPAGAALKDYHKQKKAGKGREFCHEAQCIKNANYRENKAELKLWIYCWRLGILGGNDHFFN